ncbi:mitotic spindle checkpoint protein Bub3, partial [Coemansia nantahalensis]
MSKQFELGQPPGDGISGLRFHPEDDSALLAGSWDKQVRLYDTQGNALRASHHDHQAAVLGVAFNSSGDCAFSGGLDRRVLAWEGGYTQTREVGRHDGEISALEFCAGRGLLVSGSWDRTL